MNPRHFGWIAVAALALALAGRPALAADWPQWGRDHTRNAVSPEKGVPDFQLELTDDKEKIIKPERGVAWKATLGTMTVVPPAVANGLVWIGSNRIEQDKDGQNLLDAAVLKCFRELDGKFLWEYVSPRLGKEGGWAEDFARTPIGSVPLIEGDRLWFVTNRTEVVCLDYAALRKGTGNPQVAWKLDMRKELGVYPHLPNMQFGFGASVAGYKDWLFVVTHNGVDENRTKAPKPDAPSLVCLDKVSGKVLWKDNSPGKDILAHQLSSPLVAEIGGKPQVIVGQGDGWLRSFEAATGKLIWKCDLNPKRAKWESGGRSDRNYIVASPVLYDDRIYIATGQHAEANDGPGCLYCIDPTKAGDVSRELDDGPGKGKPNPNSAIVWHTLGPFPDGVPDHGAKKDILKSRGYLFGRTISSCTVNDGLVYAADVAGYFFCFDSKTGRPFWIFDLKAMVYGQPLCADGKVFISSDDGDIFVFAHGKEKKLIATIESGFAIRPGLIFTNKTLYVTGERTLYAIRSPK